jgi:hypothetical protein
MERHLDVVRILDNMSLAVFVVVMKMVFICLLYIVALLFIFTASMSFFVRLLFTGAVKTWKAGSHG